MVVAKITTSDNYKKINNSIMTVRFYSWQFITSHLDTTYLCTLLYVNILILSMCTYICNPLIYVARFSDIKIRYAQQNPKGKTNKLYVLLNNL